MVATCRSLLQAGLQLDHCAANPAFHRAERHAHALGQIVIGIAVEKCAAQRRALVGGKPSRQPWSRACSCTFPKRRQPWRPNRQPRLPLRSASCAVHPRCAQPVDRAVSGDRDQPGHRAGPAGVKIRGLAPHRHIDLLQTSSASPRSPKIRRQTPKSFAEVRRYTFAAPRGRQPEFGRGRRQ